MQEKHDLLETYEPKKKTAIRELLNHRVFQRVKIKSNYSWYQRNGTSPKSKCPYRLQPVFQ